MQPESTPCHIELGCKQRTVQQNRVKVSDNFYILRRAVCTPTHYRFNFNPFLTEPQKDALNSSYYIVNNEFDSFSRKWFETEIVYPSSSVTGDDREDSPSPPSLASSLKTGQPYYMGFDQNEEGYGERSGHITW